MDDATQHKVNELLEYAELGQADEIRSLGSRVHDDGYYVKVGSREYSVRIARYDGKRGLIREADALKRSPKEIAPDFIALSTASTTVNNN